MQNYPGAFVVGTGRCGSTLLSNALALDPDTLSLSELFFCLHPDAFPPGVISGPKLWEILSARSGAVRVLMDIGAEPPEFLYPLREGHRFSRSNGVPRVLCVTLPAICDDSDSVYDRLAETVPSFPEQTAAEHYHQLFTQLAHWLGRSRWVERSGASGFFADQLVKNFPGGKFIHLTRGTEATAQSMAKHSVFRFIALRMEFIRRCGADVFDSQGDLPGDLPDASSDLADLLPGRLSRESLATWEPGINTFRMLVGFQRNRIKAALKRLPDPEEQVLIVRYEDLLDNATPEFERIAGFLGLAHPPEWAKQAAALVRRPSAGSQGSS